MSKIIAWIKANKVIGIVVLVLLIGFIATSYSSCRLDRAVKAGEKAYNELKSETNASATALDKKLTQLQKERAKLDAIIEGDDEEIKTLHKNNQTALQKHNADLHKKDLTIAQERRRATNANNLIQDMGVEIEALNLAVFRRDKQIANLDLQIVNLNQKYNDEHKLRLACEKQYKLLKLSVVIPKFNLFSRICIGPFAGLIYGADKEVHFGIGFGVTFRLNRG